MFKFLLSSVKYDYYVYSKKTFMFHLIYTTLMLIFVFYVFFITLYYRNQSLNIYDVWDVLNMLIWNCYYALPKLLFLVLLILVVSYILIIIILFHVITLYLKKTALSMYLYLLQFDIFNNFAITYGILEADYTYLFMHKIEQLTKNASLGLLAYYIWPRSINFIEKMIYFSFLPILLAYDWWFNQGNLSKIFMVMPWYYIYSILRVSRQTFYKFITTDNYNLSEQYYGAIKKTWLLKKIHFMYNKIKEFFC